MMQGPLREFEKVRQEQRDISHAVRDVMQARGRLGDVTDRVLGFLLSPVTERVNVWGESEVYTTDAIGLKHGLQQVWRKHDQKESESQWEHGKRHGVGWAWHPNGQKHWEMHCEHGKLHGLELGWYTNGQKRNEMHWEHGKRHGLEQGWYKNGRKCNETQWEHGIIVMHIAWDMDGRVALR